MLRLSRPISFCYRWCKCLNVFSLGSI